MVLSTPKSEASFDIGDLLDEFMSVFKDYIDRYCHIRGGYGRLRQLYHAQLWRKDIHSRFIVPDTGEFTGMIKGVTDKGCLLVENPEGTVREFSFKEISYVI
jgi:biotin-(acetyl-CoA carboxylase) ligase